MNANQNTTNKATGKPMNRVDGRLKVTGAGVANAVYHATGKRVRDLPITPDKLL